MQRFLFAALVAVVVAEASAVPELFSDEHIRQVNLEATTWTAGRNFPEGTSEFHIKGLLGGALKSPKRALPLKEEDHAVADEDIPETFDARLQWPKCADLIGQVPDQSACRSTWAIPATSAMSDRICIASGGSKKVLVSTIDLVSCCKSCGKGCDGGYADWAWRWWKDVGIVTGGGYNSSIGCKPYPFPPCDHLGNSSQYAACPSTMRETPECDHKCDADLSYQDELVIGREAYYVGGIEGIQKDMLKNGPLQAVFIAYDDFPLYKSGVYKRSYSAREMGGHGVKVIGWGTENGTPYWLAVNSWNEGWGDKGMFKISRGDNGCDFEEDVCAGYPN